MTPFILKTFLKDRDWVSFFLVWQYLWKHLAYSRHWNNKFKTDCQGVKQEREGCSFPGRQKQGSAVRKLSSSTTDRSCSELVSRYSSRSRTNLKVTEGDHLYHRWRCYMTSKVTCPSGILSYPGLWVSSSSEFHPWTSDDRAELGITFTLSMAKQFHQNYNC